MVSEEYSEHGAWCMVHGASILTFRNYIDVFLRNRRKDN